MTSNWQITRELSEESSEIVTIRVKSVNSNGVSSTDIHSNDAIEQYSFTAGLIAGNRNLLNLASKSCSQTRWNYLNSIIKYYADDVLIVSYPKCGTTWSEQCSLLLKNGGDANQLNPQHKNTYLPGINAIGKLWPEASLEQTSVDIKDPEFQRISLDDFLAAPRPRILKSHASVETLLGNNLSEGKVGLEALPPGMKVVIVTRNPLDACVSSYYHAFNPFKQGWPFEAWALTWLSGNVIFGSWFDWVKDWHEQIQKHPDRALWIQYEDLQMDPIGTVSKLANYLQFPASYPIDNALIEKVVALSSMDSMKSQAESKVGDTIGHLRKGVSGDWKNHFTQELYQEFVSKYKIEMKGTGLKYPIGPDEPILTADD